jgi:integrase
MSTADFSGKRVTVWVKLFPDRPHLMLQWHDPVTGKRKSRTAGTCNPLEAEKRRSDLEYELNHGLYQEPSRITWERFRELFEAEYVAGLRPNTRRNYATALDLFEEICTPGRLSGIDVRTVSAFVSGLRKRPTWGREGMAPSTIDLHLQALHSALTWAVRQRMLPDMPEFPKVRVPEKYPQPVAPETFERLFAKAPDANMRAYLLTGWLAGLRLEEAFLLEWEPTTAAPWVDLAEDRIVLPAELVKGVRDQWVPLDPVLKAALLALPRHGRRVFTFTDNSGRRAGLPVLVGAVSDRVLALAKQAGVRLSMRALRRGFACRYAGKVPAQVLQRLMRHRRIQTTMEYYANVDDAVREAVLGKKAERPRQPADPGPNSLPKEDTFWLRNGSRNGQPEAGGTPGTGDATTPSADGPSATP